MIERLQRINEENQVIHTPYPERSRVNHFNHKYDTNPFPYPSLIDAKYGQEDKAVFDEVSAMFNHVKTNYFPIRN